MIKLVSLLKHTYKERMQKRFNKELVMTKENNEDFKILNVRSVTMIMLIMTLM